VLRELFGTVRIAYITTYQGPTLLEKRPIVRNRSLSNTVKIELIASLLRANGHEVEVLSQGEVVDNKLKFYTGFSEPQPFDSKIPVHYSSAFPVRRVNGFWSSFQTLRLLKARHHETPFDLVIIFNLKDPQVACANYALKRLRIPVILEYEDDRFVNVIGRGEDGSFFSEYRNHVCKRLLGRVSGCIGVSPYLLSQIPEKVPKMLLRGVVGQDLSGAGQQLVRERANRILFSGTHIESNGVANLIEAWRFAPINNWELHITGQGQLTSRLRQMAEHIPGVVFHGLVSRQRLVELMSSAKICINPHTVSKTPGIVFSFKIIEYLAAGAHCVTTPMGNLESDLEVGITYMPDNAPQTISATLQRVIAERQYERVAPQAAQTAYGTRAVSAALGEFLEQVVRDTAEESFGREPAPAEVFRKLQ
jgi:Glycosyl transferases group 1/Glycosyl transferase 4-like domain